jgi:hypothetical protein
VIGEKLEADKLQATKVTELSDLLNFAAELPPSPALLFDNSSKVKLHLSGYSFTTS